MTVPTLENAIGLDTSDRTSLGRALGMDGMGAGDEADASGAGLPTKEEARYLKLAQEAEALAIQNMSAGIRSAWARAYEAYNNRHHAGSKYHSAQYQGRSKLFRPKTRIAVRKKLKSAAAALFGTGDVVAIDPQDETNDMEKASAALKQQLVNYRLKSSRRRVGIPWFQIALGSVETATVAGIITSKQSWKYQEEDGETILDRPDIQLYPPENVLLDPNCDWTNPAQTAQFIGLRNFYAPGDAWQMVKKGTEVGSKIPWIPGLKKSDFESRANTGPSDTAATRVARDGKADPMAQATNSFKRVCLTEWFMRADGGEWVFWTIGTDRIISTPIKVRKAYPEQKGERPIVIGVGAIEAFKVHPMSPVESWAPLQQEVNDAANLRLDHMKQIVSPPTLVKRGKKVDLKAVQGRGPNRVIMVDDPDDVSTMPMSDTPQGAFQENNYLNADMDDLTGTMNVGTVQTNQSLNETVGGMSLLAGDADSAGEFDLSVWVETWCKPVISQIVSLEEFWEDDATILAVCGMKAQLIQKYGINQITDHMLMMDCETVIHVGVGSASHPMKRLQQFMAASNAVGGMLAPLVQGGIIQPPRPKVKAVIDEIYGSAGIKDASARFFQPIDDNAPPPQPQQQQPDPNKWAQLQTQQQIEGMRQQTKQQELGQRAQEHQDKMANAAQERQAKAENEHVRSLASIGQQIMQQRAQQQQAAMQAQHDMVKAKIANDAEAARDQAMNLHTLLKNAVDKGAQQRQQQFGEQAKAVHSVLDHHAQAARAEQAHRHKMQQGAQTHVAAMTQQSQQQDAEQSMAGDQRQHEAKQADKAHGQAVALEKVRAKNKPKPTAGARPKPKGKK